MGLSDDIEELEPPEESDPVAAAPYLWLDDHVMSARIQPDDAPYLFGTISMYVGGTDDTISVGVDSERAGTSIDSGFHLSPRGAEQLAELLKGAAAKAREGTEWQHR